MRTTLHCNDFHVTKKKVKNKPTPAFPGRGNDNNYTNLQIVREASWAQRIIAGIIIVLMPFLASIQMSYSKWNKQIDALFEFEVQWSRCVRVYVLRWVAMVRGECRQVSRNDFGADSFFFCPPHLHVDHGSFARVRSVVHTLILFACASNSYSPRVRWSCCCCCCCNLHCLTILYVLRGME